jgi:hypothetical protein
VCFSIFYPNIFKIVSSSRLASGGESSRRENARRLSENFHLRLDIPFFESSSSDGMRYRVSPFFTQISLKSHPPAVWQAGESRRGVRT